MTTGQRIAAKRKEQGLSQEELGARLQVSRQSIYKWESDSSLPEVDKLVALSRLFGVSVGWLLGVEDGESAAGGALTEEQLNMVKEIVDRYRPEGDGLSDNQREQVEQLVAEKSGGGKKRRRWPAVAVIAVLAAVLLWQNARMSELEARYRDLNNGISTLNHTVSSQIGSIAGRVESILKEQNDLTADYAAELLSADLRQNTVTFTARAVPKTYVEGMRVVFQTEQEGNVLEFEGTEGPGREFSATLTCPLSDSIALSAVFVQGNTRQTQVLERFDGLYTASMPEVMLMNAGLFVWPEDLSWQEGVLTLPEDYVYCRTDLSTASAIYEGVETAQLKRVEVGLFRNERLVCWLTPCEQPNNYQGFEDCLFYRLEPISLPLQEGDRLCVAALVTDTYGRQQVFTDPPGLVVSGGELTNDYDGPAYRSWPDGWDFTAP